jgi:hypothetical protein
MLELLVSISEEEVPSGYLIVSFLFLSAIEAIGLQQI